MKKLFLDSDIILDALLNRPGFDTFAKNVFELIYKRQFMATTSSVAFVNIHYFLNKYDKANKYRLLKSLRLIISITETSEMMIDLALKTEPADFEDAVQYYSAKSAKADFIITRNIKDYKDSDIPVLTAEQFLKTL